MTEISAVPKPGRARKTLRPRDAATLIAVDDSSGEPRVLLGRRRHDLVFMPGRYVFPGGRVDPGDRHVPFHDDLAPGTIKKLMVDMKGQPSPARARGLALAAIREMFEEAGLIIGKPTQAEAPPRAKTWQPFFAQGFQPALAQLTFFARAITPPGGLRRFDTRFFCAPASAIVHKVAISDGELSELEWHSITQARTLELPNITRVILEDLGDLIAAGALHNASVPAPFYHRRAGTFHRDVIATDSNLD